ncbi:MAG: GtrA family protein [Clostridiales bacterium]|nr:GtrA family protein [Clostridiales bacterium]
MIDRIKALLVKYKRLIMYGIFGVLTTVVNIAAYWVLAHLFHLPTVAANSIAWVISCTFAYITNRIWVFESQEKKKTGIIREIVMFFVCRLFTLGVEDLMMYVFIDRLGFNDLIIKIIANIVVIILNYVGSLFVVFTKRKKGGEDSSAHAASKAASDSESEI